MLPVIGVTPDEGKSIERVGRPATPRYELKRAYSDALVRAGAVPIILPYSSDGIDQVLDLVSGVVVTGGAFDIDPAKYNAQRHPRTGLINAGRTDFEWRLMEAAIARGFPILGICGGMQLLNVVRGGTLQQHIESHEQPNDPCESAHPVAVKAGTLLSLIVGERINVNSTHHQAIDRVGRSLRVSATASDGIVEAIEDEKAPFLLGVQWHPESLDDAPSRAIFEAFVAAAK